MPVIVLYCIIYQTSESPFKVDKSSRSGLYSFNRLSIYRMLRKNVPWNRQKRKSYCMALIFRYIIMFYFDVARFSWYQTILLAIMLLLINYPSIKWYQFCFRLNFSSIFWAQYCIFLCIRYLSIIVIIPFCSAQFSSWK